MYLPVFSCGQRYTLHEPILHAHGQQKMRAIEVECLLYLVLLPLMLGQHVFRDTKIAAQLLRRSSCYSWFNKDNVCSPIQSRIDGVIQGEHCGFIQGGLGLMYPLAL